MTETEKEANSKPSSEGFGGGEDKFALQDSLYEFPYHYIPHMRPHDSPTVSRSMAGGLRYLCYLFHAREMALSTHPDSVLEVGCGDGRFVGLLKNEISRAVGVDLSDRAIRFAQAFHRDVEFYSKDAAELEESFDLVSAIEVLEHIPDKDVSAFLKTLFARTNPGGYVLISVPTTVIPLNNKHYRHYNEKLLKEHLAEAGVDYNLVQMDWVYRETLFMRWYHRLTLNRFWTLEIQSLQNLVWRHVWRHCRHANESNGQHLIALLEVPKITRQ